MTTPEYFYVPYLGYVKKMPIKEFLELYEKEHPTCQ
jgi:hypothetical protein